MNISKPGFRKALISGFSGQDGIYLADFLLRKNYQVWGTTRNIVQTKFQSTFAKEVVKRVKVVNMQPENYESVLSVVNSVKPDEIYNLAGQSSVRLSYEQPVVTTRGIVLGNLNFLEVIRTSASSARYFSAGSSECFGDSEGVPASEETIFCPVSPYGAAKAAAFSQVKIYRDVYGIFACTGILFNHESPLRPSHFVTKKIVETACRIMKGSNEILNLGNTTIVRDWGWAPEYVEAMWMMLNRNEAEDFVIATGVGQTLQAFVESVFWRLGLDPRNQVKSGVNGLRKNEAVIIEADISKAQSVLGWCALTSGAAVAEKLVDAELTALDSGGTS